MSNITEAIYTPPEVSTFGIEHIKRMGRDDQFCLVTGLADLDKYFVPLRPGQICSIIGQTSNSKTELIKYIGLVNARRVAQAKLSDHVLIHISVEDLVEEQAIGELARLSGEVAADLAVGKVRNWKALEEAADKVAKIPIIRIGESLGRPDVTPNLYVSNMLKAIDQIVSGKLLGRKIKIAGLFFDYLQAFPIDPEIMKIQKADQRRLQVRADIYAVRQAAVRYGCGVFVNVQAKQKLDGANPPVMLPGIYDGEESSSIGQRSDRVLTIWMPKTTHQVGERIEKGKISFVVEDNLVLIKVAKQRGRLPAGKTFFNRIDFNTGNFYSEAYTG